MIETPNTKNLSEIISTLVINGFHINKVQRFLNNNILNIYKFDKLGAEVKYSILFSDETEETPLSETLITYSKSYNSTPLVVCDTEITDKCKVYSKEKFFDFFTSFVNTGLILIPNLPEVLDTLGHNKVPNGLDGEADELLEVYSKECLQFILESPSKRFGQDRSFEHLPDGIVLAKQKFIILFDSKAYGNGFKFKSDDINRFAKYVENFNKRYSAIFGNVFSFLVISGKFLDSVKSISNRSDELYRQSNCKLSCITGEELGKIVQILKGNSAFSSAIIWKNILTELIIDTKIVEKEIKRIKKDNLI